MKAIANVTQNRNNLSGSALRSTRRGFTLIEMLVVIAITAILFTLVFRPLVDSLNLTNRATAQIESQTEARQVLRDVSTLLNNAAYVFDNKTSAAAINLWFKDSQGNPTFVPTQYAMVEFVPPARLGDQNPNATVIDPTTGLPYYASPTSVQAGYAYPITAGRTLVRIFPGLTNNASGPDTRTGNSFPGDAIQDGMPTTLYGNRFSDPRAVGVNQDNRYSLFRADVTTSIPDPNNPKVFIPNLMLFHTGANGSGAVNTRTGALVLHDPNFYYDNSLAGDASDQPGSTKWAVYGWKDLNGDGKVEIWENWRAVSSSMLTLSRADAVALQRDDSNNITYDSYNRPIPRPLVTFGPAYVENDPGVASALENAGNEAPNPASPTYNFQYYRWNNPYTVTIYHSLVANTDPLAPNQAQEYFVTNGNGTITENKVAAGSTQVQSTSYGPFLIGNGVFDPALIQTLPLAFTVDSERGLVNFAFPSTVMVHGPNTGSSMAPYYAPLPSVFSPNDTNQGMNGTYQERYIDLRGTNGVLPATDSFTNQPLNPSSALSPLGTNMPWYNTVSATAGGAAVSGVSIVPGSERVYGPDQRPGPHYGQSVLYTRVASQSGTIGPNQYKINYQDVPSTTVGSTDPRLCRGFIQFDSLPDSGDPYVSNQPITTNGQASQLLHSLPLYKADAYGRIQTSTPADPIMVYYNFQMNSPNDVVKASYQTRAQMVLSVEARVYDAATGAPQTTTLTQSVDARNLQH